MPTIVLADDHPIVRYGLRIVLEAEADFSIVGEAEDGQAAMDMVQALEPTLLIVDLVMPRLSGLEVARQVSQRALHTRVIILTMHADEAYVLGALRNGAAAYILKDARAADLVAAVRAVVAGRRYLSPPLSERAIETYIRKAKDTPEEPYETLTNREREVLHLAAQGAINAELAARLSISPRTAEVHRASVMRKLDLRSQTDLIRYALRHGIITLVHVGRNSRMV